MRDFEIRQELRRRLLDQHADEFGTLIIDELSVCQDEARADIVVVNGMLTCYEIKSDRDTLDRLPGQQAAYNKVFDRVYVVAGECHVEPVIERIPDWWGVLSVGGTSEQIAICEARPAGDNPSPCAFSLATFLWRNEVLDVLVSNGIDRGVRSKPRTILQRRLAESLPCGEIAAIVRTALKTRGAWRSGLQRT